MCRYLRTSAVPGCQATAPKEASRRIGALVAMRVENVIQHFRLRIDNNILTYWTNLDNSEFLL